MTAKASSTNSVRIRSTASEVVASARRVAWSTGPIVFRVAARSSILWSLGRTARQSSGRGFIRRGVRGRGVGRGRCRCVRRSPRPWRSPAPRACSRRATRWRRARAAEDSQATNTVACGEGVEVAGSSGDLEPGQPLVRCPHGHIVSPSVSGLAEAAPRRRLEVHPQAERRVFKAPPDASSRRASGSWCSSGGDGPRRDVAAARGAYPLGVRAGPAVHHEPRRVRVAGRVTGGELAVALEHRPTRARAGPDRGPAGDPASRSSSTAASGDEWRGPAGRNSMVAPGSPVTRRERPRRVRCRLGRAPDRW